MKKLLLLLMIPILLLTGCTADDPGYVLNPPGTPIEVDTSGSLPYYVGVSEGEVAGHKTFWQLGYNSSVGTTEEDIWYASSTFVFPAAGQQMAIHSSNANDTANGTGVRSVIIYYLDDNYIEHTEIVTMDGATPVATVATDIFRINDFMAYTTGTGYKAAGHISIGNIGGTEFYDYIRMGYTEARNSAYTVPAGKSVYITEFFTGVGGLATNMCRITLRGTYNYLSNILLTPGLFFMPYAEIVTNNGANTRQFTVPLRFYEKTDIKVSAMVDTGTAYVEISYRGWIETD